MSSSFWYSGSGVVFRLAGVGSAIWHDKCPCYPEICETSEYVWTDDDPFSLQSPPEPIPIPGTLVIEDKLTYSPATSTFTCTFEIIDCYTLRLTWGFSALSPPATSAVEFFLNCVGTSDDPTEFQVNPYGYTTFTHDINLCLGCETIYARFIHAGSIPPSPPFPGVIFAPGFVVEMLIQLKGPCDVGADIDSGEQSGSRFDMEFLFGEF